MGLLMINEVEHGFEATLIHIANDVKQQLVVCLSILIKLIDFDLSCAYLVALLFFSWLNENPNYLPLNKYGVAYT